MISRFFSISRQIGGKTETPVKIQGFAAFTSGTVTKEVAQRSMKGIRTSCSLNKEDHFQRKKKKHEEKGKTLCEMIENARFNEEPSTGNC